MMITRSKVQELHPLATVPIRRHPLPAEYPGAHAFDQDEEEALLRVLRSKTLYRYHGMDPQREATQFEIEFAAFAGVRHAVAVTSGTAALHTALGALGVGPGQEVIIPAYLWVSIAASVVNLGAIPVLADIDETFTLDPEDLRRRITPRTSVILLAHMNGAPGNILEVAGIAREHGIYLVEDCAQCVGGTIQGRSVGSFGDIAIFSFQINKNMSSGEGGAVVTNSEALWRKAVAIQDVGYARDTDDKMDLLDAASFSWGRGYRLDELRAAILRVQLRKLPSILARMRKSKSRIRKALERLPGLRFRCLIDSAGDTGAFLLTIFPTVRTARAVNERMRWHGIVCSADAVSNVILADYGLHIYSNIPGLVQKTGTDRKGAPWSLLENRDSVYDYNRGCCPSADDLFQRTQLLTIPSCLSERDEQDVIDAFTEALAWAGQG
jgi:8-amino-3,8-dideoxy-alpha-D-manno-octulosonate transaminase